MYSIPTADVYISYEHCREDITKIACGLKY